MRLWLICGFDNLNVVIVGVTALVIHIPDIVCRTSD